MKVIRRAVKWNPGTSGVRLNEVSVLAVTIQQDERIFQHGR